VANENARVYFDRLRAEVGREHPRSWSDPVVFLFHLSSAGSILSILVIIASLFNLLIHHCASTSPAGLKKSHHFNASLNVNPLTPNDL
jgi:hypothetical protein